MADGPVVLVPIQNEIIYSKKFNCKKCVSSNLSTCAVRAAINPHSSISAINCSVKFKLLKRYPEMQLIDRTMLNSKFVGDAMRH